MSIEWSGELSPNPYLHLESRSPPRMLPPVPCHSARCSHIVTYDQHFDRHEWEEYVQESDRHRQRQRQRDREDSFL